MTTAALVSLGCKVNQCEAAYVEEQLEAAGFLISPFSQRADLYCINTCAVTARAAMQSRQLIRRAVRRNPEARVVVMGCYPQVAPAEIAGIQGVTHILGTTEKPALVDLLSAHAGSGPPAVLVSDARRAPEPPPLVLKGFPHRTRAFLKIQDGCDAFCSYCVVPSARGRSVFGITAIGKSCSPAFIWAAGVATWNRNRIWFPCSGPCSGSGPCRASASAHWSPGK
jgi:threonylcarbamoyladenosine tRNA methylthiotransferase MtaB